MGKFRPGVSGNPTGRPPGTPNKVTGELRDKLNAIVESELTLVPQLLEKLEPKERLELVLKMLAFVLPKLRAIEHSGQFEDGEDSLGKLLKEIEAMGGWKPGDR